MKLLKYLLFLVLLLLIGGAIFFSTKDGSFDVSETKVINAPSEMIYNQIKDFNTWQNWGPWLQIDPNIQISQSKKSEGVGATYAWKSNHEALGTVSIETKKVIPLKEIDQEISIQTPLGELKNNVYWRFEKTEKTGQTKVTWGVKGDPTFLEKFLMSFRAHDIGTGIGILFPQGFTNLNRLIIEEMNRFVINVDGITDYDGGYYIYLTNASKLTEVNSKVSEILKQVRDFVKENKLQTNGLPFTIFNEIDRINETAIYSICIPVADKVVTANGSKVLCGYMPEVKALKTTLKGNYIYLEKAYSQAFEYLTANNIVENPTQKIFEVYYNDSNVEYNPANWITEIYIPIVQLSNIQD